VGAVEHYFADFTRVEAQLAGANVPWLRDARRQALNRFAQSGFPSTREEEWKYTDLRRIEKRRFQIPSRSGNGLSAAELAPSRFVEGLDCHELVFVNGHYAEQLSNPGGSTNNTTFEDLASVLAKRPHLLNDHIARCVGRDGAAFTALNDAFMTDGAYIRLAADTILEKPIHLLFVATELEFAPVSHPRIYIDVGANSEVKIIETYVGLRQCINLTNVLTEIVAGANSQIEHYKVQSESRKAYHIANLYIDQQRDSRVISHSIALGAALSRNDIRVNLDAKGASITLNGLYMASGKQHVDHHTQIDHAKAHTHSEEFFKGVLNGYGRGVFNGKVVVHEDAQKSDAHQSNKNLLLSANAEVDTKPELEIYADDVNCTHGATVGQLDEAALFYLRSRGVGLEAARGLLTYAFADDVIARVDIAPIRKRLKETVLGQLPDSELVRDFV
jgi:Fe-S cluster assembly protein SufD